MSYNHDETTVEWQNTVIDLRDDEIAELKADLKVANKQIERWKDSHDSAVKAAYRKRCELEAEIERLEAQIVLEQKYSEDLCSKGGELEAEIETLRVIEKAARALALEVDTWAEDAGGYAPAWFDLEKALEGKSD